MVGEEFKDIPVFQVIRRQIFNVILGFGHPLLTEREEMLDGRRRRYRRTADQNNGTAEDLDGDGGGLSGCPSAQDFPGIVGTYRLDLQDRTRKFGNLAQPKLLSHETWSQNYDLLDSMEVCTLLTYDDMSYGLCIPSLYASVVPLSRQIHHTSEAIPYKSQPTMTIKVKMSLPLFK